jgi:endonuclease III
MKKEYSKMQEFYPNVEKITAELVERFGHSTLGNKCNPFNELLYIILSSRTSLERCRNSYVSLKRKFRKFDDLAIATVDEIASTIVDGGLQKRKAKGISLISRQLIGLYGHVTLNPLTKMTDQEAEIFLLSLPEVNIKMARCVLLYSLKRNVFPVDTHCFHVAQKIGWIDRKSSITKKRADKMQTRIPSNLRKDLHVGMVLLGRKYCTFKLSYCTECPIKKICKNASLL